MTQLKAGIQRAGQEEGGWASNLEIAKALDETGGLLANQGANPFRSQAYHNAAMTIRKLTEPIARIVYAEGLNGLIALPTIGKSLAHSIDHMVRTGRLPLLERLRGDEDPERLFATVADIGPRLAQRIHEHLGVETLDELQAAANDGRLATVSGMGAKRIRAVRESLAGRMLQRDRVHSPPPVEAHANEFVDTTPVEELLSIDAEYRRLATAGQLPRIAPKRFNPTREAWLPVLHTERGDRHYTALYSNTARAHELGATHDWVVLFRDDSADHDHWTIITSQFGRLRGKRIVRGRETDCENYYQHLGGVPSRRGA